jgi:hypothetical protein
VTQSANLVLNCQTCGIKIGIALRDGAATPALKPLTEEFRREHADHVAEIELQLTAVVDSATTADDAD